MSFDQVFNRAAAVAHFLTLIGRMPRVHAVQEVGSRFGVCSDAINRAITSTAVREYLHAVGLSHEPALEVLIAAAKKFRIPTEELQSAVDEHIESVEA